MRKDLFLVLALVALAGCAHKRKVVTASPPRPAPRAPAKPVEAKSVEAKSVEAKPIGYNEMGTASWYGNPYHGRKAANGETYDMEKMTAAHRTLPFNTWVRVENLTNRKSVEVRITDRGPFIDGRIIDLSHAAAQAIEMIGPGTARVRLEVIRTPSEVLPGVFAVQVGAFRDRSNAERARERLASQFGGARLVLREGNPNIWRVLVGSEATEEGATALAEKIRQEIGEKNAFVVRLDSVQG